MAGVSSKRPHVLVIGAGIGGLTAAIALLKKGFDVDVYERASELTEVGAGLHLSPNGTKTLYNLGLKEALDRVAVNQTDREVALWNTGQAWKIANHGTSAASRFGAPYLLMHRGDLHALLVQGVKDLKHDAIHVNAKCTGIEQDGAGVTITFENGETVRGDALVGADGFHSAARHTLFGQDNPRFTGYIAWRGLIPIEKVPQGIAHYSAAWMGPAGQITLYPVHRGELLNFVGITLRDDWRVESWTVAGSRDECANDFKGWHPAILELIRNIDTPYKWGLFSRDPIPGWSQGRITLLGDACHSMLPFLGQGANIAVEDGFVLARCLDASPEDIPAAFARYEAARRPRATRVVLETLEQWKKVRHPDIGDPEKAPGYVEREWSPEKMKGRYDWIFEYDVATTPI